MNETALSLAIREALLATGRVVLWRHNTGKLPDARGRWVTYGLGLGGADLVGILKPSGRFIAFEVKMPGKNQTPEQRAWERAAVGAGGFYRVVRSVAEALAALEVA